MPAHKKTTQQFIIDAKQKHGEQYNYDKVDYKNNHTKIIIICSINDHGEFEQTPDNHLSGNGCPRCSENKKLTTEEFIQKSNIIHNDKFIYDKCIYLDSKTKVIIICPNHGDFKQIPSSHLMGRGCPNCNHRISEGEQQWLISRHPQRSGTSPSQSIIK